MSNCGTYLYSGRWGFAYNWNRYHNGCVYYGVHGGDHPCVEKALKEIEQKEAAGLGHAIGDKRG